MLRVILRFFEKNLYMDNWSLKYIFLKIKKKAGLDDMQSQPLHRVILARSNQLEWLDDVIDENWCLLQEQLAGFIQ